MKDTDGDMVYGVTSPKSFVYANENISQNMFYSYYFKFSSEKNNTKKTFNTYIFNFAPVANANVSVEMLNKEANGNKMVFSKEIVKIVVGDTVNWIPTSKGHNVEKLSSPNGLEFKSGANETGTITFDVPGIYYYGCSPHKSMGMIGLVIVGDNTANKNEIANSKAPGRSKFKLKKLLEAI